MARQAIKIAVLYSLFAALSTGINIVSQMLSIWTYRGPYSIELSIIVGTLSGLPLRYVLEKKFIFQYSSQNIQHDGKLFVLYSFMGVFTTLIFWLTEYAFHLMFLTDNMRYVGAILGLSLGYYVKYQLDKRYVFIKTGMGT
jgi:hypothetical protein